VLPYIDSPEWISGVALTRFLDYTVRGGLSKTTYFPDRRPIRNTHIISALSKESIVVEYSPPSTILISALLEKSTHVAIGYYIGSSIAGANHWLLLMSVPSAIVVVGAAVGVSDGLVRGLTRAVERAVEKWVP